MSCKALASVDAAVVPVMYPEPPVKVWALLVFRW